MNFFCTTFLTFFFTFIIDWAEKVTFLRTLTLNQGEHVFFAKSAFFFKFFFVKKRQSSLPQKEKILVKKKCKKIFFYVLNLHVCVIRVGIIRKKISRFFQKQVPFFKKNIFFVILLLSEGKFFQKKFFLKNSWCSNSKNEKTRFLTFF